MRVPRKGNSTGVGPPPSACPAGRLGLEITSLPYDPVPSRLLRPYALIGWDPAQAR